MKGAIRVAINRRACRSACRSGGATDGGRLEPLERRAILSASVLQDGTLEVLGSSADETIVLTPGGAGPGSVAVAGVPDVPDGTVFDNVLRVRVEAGAGNDRVAAQGNVRAEDGTRMRFTFLGGDGDDNLTGSNAVDELRGENGDDFLGGRDGGDKLLGGPGDDTMQGQKGNDRLEGGDGNDVLLGGPKNDAMYGDAHNDDLRGGGGEDALRGGSGEDDLIGGKATDQLYGQADRDRLRGPLAEFKDFSSLDAFHSPLIGTPNQALVGLTAALWSAVDSQAGEGDLSGDTVRFLDSIQLIKARAADERLEFDVEWAMLTEQQRADAREDFGGIIDDFLLDIEDNPSGLDSVRLLLFKGNVLDEFPEDVRDEFNDYIDAMIELDDQVADLGDAMDDLQADGLGDPYLTEFALLFEF